MGLLKTHKPCWLSSGNLPCQVEMTWPSLLHQLRGVLWLRYAHLRDIGISILRLGFCARMGDVITQDWAYTIEVLLALVEMYEQEWQTFNVQMPLPSVCACMFLLVSSLGGMRGFEVVWTDLAALRYNVSFCETAEDESAVSWPILGRLKLDMVFWTTIWSL